MKYFIFYREDNVFDDIFSDSNLKNYFKYKLQWFQFLILGSDKSDQKMESYLYLKYGDDIKDKSFIILDRKPKMHVDYEPDPKRPKRFRNL